MKIAFLAVIVVVLSPQRSDALLEVVNGVPVVGNVLQNLQIANLLQSLLGGVTGGGGGLPLVGGLVGGQGGQGGLVAGIPIAGPLLQSLLGAVGGVAGSVSGVLKGLTGTITGLTGTLSGALKNIPIVGGLLGPLLDENGVLGIVGKTLDTVLSLVTTLLDTVTGLIQGLFKSPEYADKKCTVNDVKIDDIKSLEFHQTADGLSVVAKVDVSCTNAGLPAPQVPTCLVVAGCDKGVTNLQSATLYCNFLPDPVKLNVPA